MIKSKGWLEHGLISHLNKEQSVCREMTKERSFELVCVCYCFSHVQLFTTLWAAARQAPLSMGFSRQEYWSELPFPPPGDLPDRGIEPGSFMSPLVGGFFTVSAT